MSQSSPAEAATAPQTASETPAAPETVTTPAPDVLPKTADTPVVDLASPDSMNVENLDKLMASLTAEPTEPAEAKAEAPPETPAQTEPAKEPEATAGETPPAEPEPKRVLPNRVSTSQFTEVEQEAIALGKQLKDAGEDVPSLKERIEIVEKRRSETTEATTPEPEPETDKELAEIEAELAKLSAEEEEEAKALGVDSLLGKQRRARELEAKLKGIHDQQKAVQERQNAQAQAALNAEIERAKQVYPTAKDGESELGREITALIAELHKLPPNHVDRSDLQRPVQLTKIAAERLAERLAEQNGTTYGVELDKLRGKTVTAPPPAQPKQEPRKPTPAGGAASTPPAAPIAPKALDLSSPESFDLAAIEKALPTRKLEGFYIRN